MIEDKIRLEKIIAIGNMMTRIKNTDILMEKILTESRKLVHADAGSFYTCDENNLNFTYSQNDTFQKKLGPNKKLIYNTFTMPINLNSLSGYVALKKEILNIEDVYQLAQDLPYRFNPEIDHKSGYKTKSMITIPLQTPSGKVIGILQLINAKDENQNIIRFDEADIPFLKHFANIAAVALEKAEITRSIILRMIRMAELRDPKETGAHVNRVASYAVEIYESWARKHKISENEINHYIDLLRISAMLHDVGKVGISDVILKKEGKLTDEEFTEMKKHPIIGSDLFDSDQSELDALSGIIALHHHERWDGRGYPERLAGEDIPLMARIVALADVYDALSSKRCYKEAWSQDQVWAEIQNQAGSQFDPELVEIFTGMKELIISIQNRYPDKH